MSGAYRVKNWDKYQHYKDRNPPWIKLHFEILSSEDWVMLDDPSRVLAIACMLIASRNDGNVPDNPAYVQRVAYLNKKPDFKPLVSCGFLEPGPDMLADASRCKQMQADARPETEAETEAETETETETEERKKERKKRPRYADDFELFWKKYPRKEDKPLAARAFSKAKKAGLPAIDELLSTLDRQIEHKKRCDVSSTFCAEFPYGVRWLERCKWEDEIPEPKRPGLSCGNGSDPNNIFVGGVNIAAKINS